MLLRSIRLKNFRQYKGKQEITFSCDSNRNVTIILGKNTSGKTTLVQAFNWVLYGEVNFTTKDLLSLDVIEQMQPGDKETVEVEICLTHDNTDYIITRSQVYTYYGKKGVRPSSAQAKVSRKNSDGQIEPIKASAFDLTINEILPQELSDYFFFDGERIGSISSKKDLTEAVKGLMGLSVLSNAMDHLNPGASKSVVGKLRSSLDTTGDQKAQEAKELIEKFSTRRKEINEELSNIDEQIETYENLKENTEDILRENQSTADYQKKRDELERAIKHEESFLEGFKGQFMDAFNNNSIGFFTLPLMNKALACLQEANISDKGIPDMNAVSIDYIIDRGYCVCGNEIKQNDEAYTHLIRERNYLPPQSIGTTIRIFKERVSSYHSTSETYYKNVESLYKQIRSMKNRIGDLKDELAGINLKIRGKEDIRKHETNLIDYKERLRNLEKRKERLLLEEGALINRIEQQQKIFDSSATASDKNRKIKLCIQYAEAIYAWIKKTYENSELEIRKELEVRVNDIFSQMYHGRRRVTINNKYRVKLLTAFGDGAVATDESCGLETVKNFAFIAGLVDLARKKIQEKNEELDMVLSSEPYPLVMDAPFSNADEKHITRISRILPEVAEQIIMVVMQRDWRFAEATIGEKVGKEYYLDKKSETLTYIKERV